MQNLLHEPSWPRFIVSISICGIGVLILFVLNLMGQRGARIQRAASSDFIAEMLRREKPADDAPQRELSRAEKQTRRTLGFVFRCVLVLIICVTGIEGILAYKTTTNFEDGLLRFKQDHLPESILAYRMALAADDRSATVQYYLGVALMANGQQPEALTAFEKAIERNPKLEKARIDYGNSLFLQRRYAEALEAYQAALQLSPKDKIARSDVAIALQALGRLEEAMPFYKQVVAAAPLDRVARLNLANVLTRLHRYSEAETEFLLLLKQAPANAPAHLNYGFMLAEQGRSAEALRQLLMATELAPADANMQVQYGNELVKQGYLPAAIAVFQHTTALDKNYAPAYYALADTLQKANRPQEAVPALQNYLKKAQDVPAYRQDVQRATESLHRLQGSH